MSLRYVSIESIEINYHTSLGRFTQNYVWQLATAKHTYVRITEVCIEYSTAGHNNWIPKHNMQLCMHIYHDYLLIQQINTQMSV